MLSPTGSWKGANDAVGHPELEELGPLPASALFLQSRV